MDTERKLITTIKTGELTPDELKRVLVALGKVMSIDAIESVRVTTSEVRPRKEKPIYPEIPQDLLGHLGLMGVEEFYKVLESQGKDSELATRLWNYLSNNGEILKSEQEDQLNPLYRSMRIGNMTNPNKWTKGQVTRELASELGYSLDLNNLAVVLINGEINKVPQVGEPTVAIYHGVVQYRIGQILSNEPTDEDTNLPAIDQPASE